MIEDGKPTPRTADDDGAPDTTRRRERRRARLHDETPGERWLRRSVVLFASGFHLLAVLTWLAPNGYVRDHILRYTRKYALYTRTDQGWGMFAPEPLSVNRRLLARATTFDGATHEFDLTAPLNAAIHGLAIKRVGKAIKAQDRLMGGDEPQYTSGFAAHTCYELEGTLGAPVRSVLLQREYQSLTVDPTTFKTTRTPWARGEIGSYDCPHP